MEKKNWNDSWILNGKEEITLPHDYVIHTAREEESDTSANEGFFCGTQCVYQKKFENIWYGCKKKILVEFEGVMGICEVFLNGTLIHKNYNYYLGFYVDLTDYLLPGENIIEVTADNSHKPSSRWYEGLGIYRPVFLHISDPIYFLPDGSFCKLITGSACQQAEIEVSHEIMSCRTLNLKYSFVILDMWGKEAARYSQDYEAVSGINQIRHKTVIKDCIFWEDQNPYLYTCIATIEADGFCDSEEIETGFRSMEVNPEQGFLVNGKKKKLYGACIHHDNGILGSASFPQAEERKIRLLKEAGFNAVRLAHSPHAKSLIRACDKYGMYVIDELYDMWNIPKKIYDYHRFFSREWKYDIYKWIMRDRNHPSVIMWSIGNEVAERDGTENGYFIAEELANECRKYDSSRYVTAAVQDTKDDFEKVTEPYFSKLDICGYNYLYDRYEKDHTSYPERILYGSESFPKYCYEAYEAMIKHPYVIGDFVWTAIDYLGEAGLGRVELKGKDPELTKPFSLGKYPWKTANCGDFSITGRKRPQSYYRDIVFGISQGPCIFTLPPGKKEKDYESHGWGFLPLKRSNTYKNSENLSYNIFVFCREGEVELFQNGVSLGRKHSGPENHYIVPYTAYYQKGTLEAVCRVNSKIQDTDMLRSVETGRHLHFSKETYQSNQDTLVYVNIICRDDFGTEVTDQSDLVKIHSFESCEMLAAGNDNPQNTENYDDFEFHLYEGRGLIILRKVSLNAKIKLEYDSQEYEVKI